MHCYSGTPEMSKKFVEMGYYLGVGGPVTRYKDVEETVRITPIDKIVIETDSPVLPSEPFEKHSRNNSLYLNYIIKKIAEKMSLDGYCILTPVYPVFKSAERTEEQLIKLKMNLIILFR